MQWSMWDLDPRFQIALNQFNITFNVGSTALVASTIYPMRLLGSCLFIIIGAAIVIGSFIPILPGNRSIFDLGILFWVFPIIGAALIWGGITSGQPKK
jgi:hypothetical protein